MGSSVYAPALLQKLFGLTPVMFIRHLGRGWSQVFSECGEIDVVSIEPRAGVVRLRGLPAACLASDAWIRAPSPISSEVRTGRRVLVGQALEEELFGTAGAGRGHVAKIGP